MADENINPQNIPIHPQENNLTDNKPRLFNLRRTVPKVLLIILTIGISVSLFWFFNQAKQKTPSIPVPTVAPTVTDVPSPIQKPVEFIISIKLGQTIIIPNTSISLTYISADIPSESCYDCVASNTLEVKNNGQTKILDYSCGGIAGECITKLKAYGYQLEILDQLSKDSLKLKIYKQ